MNDRFKFRVWDKINEIWIENPLIDARIGCVAGFYNPEEAMKRRVIVEQCTGLKDKNGNLIYEGDIVTDGADNFTVAWNYNAWCIQTNKFEHFLTEGFELIGNIHEPPELMEQSNDD